MLFSERGQRVPQVSPGASGAVRRHRCRCQPSPGHVHLKRYLLNRNERAVLQRRPSVQTVHAFDRRGLQVVRNDGRGELSAVCEVPAWVEGDSQDVVQGKRNP